VTSDTTARIAGSGSYVPDTRVDNFQLFALDSIREDFDIERARAALRDVESPEALPVEEVFDLWTRQVTGIGERRILTPESGLTTEDMCAQASLRALEAAQMEPGDLDLILVASLTENDTVPNPACTVASLIGAPQLGGYTLNAACAGFVYGIATAWASIRAGLARNILVVSGDALSRVVDYSDVTTAVLFGDGAGAVILQPSENGDGVLGTPALGGEFAREPLYLVGQGWETDEEPVPALRMLGGPRILRNAIVAMAELASRTLETADRSWADVDLLIPHQANLRITKGLEKHVDLSNGRVIHNIENYGNMSASTVAITLDEVLRGKHGELPNPALVVLTAIGGGYTTSAVAIEVRR
jgi:3-oxoacyl-[acyl-carrier-protein] synthase-3